MKTPQIILCSNDDLDGESKSDRQLPPLHLFHLYWWHMLLHKNAICHMPYLCHCVDFGLIIIFWKEPFRWHVEFHVGIHLPESTSSSLMQKALNIIRLLAILYSNAIKRKQVSINQPVNQRTTISTVLWSSNSVSAVIYHRYHFVSHTPVCADFI